MFISIKWKNTIVFTLMITAIVSIVCALNAAGILRDARLDFKNTVNSVFDSSYLSEISDFSSKASLSKEILSQDGTLASMETADNPQLVFNKLTERAYDLSLGHTRALFLLDKTGSVICSTASDSSSSFSGSFAPAFEDDSRTGFKLTRQYMDFYAKIPAFSGDEYVIYISDSNQLYHSSLVRTLTLYCKIMCVALVLCVAAGLVLSNTIAVPLQKLNVWAKQLSDGKTAVKNDIVANDELGTLAKTLELMAKNLDISAEENRNEKIKLETILQNMTDGILAFNLDGKIIHINPKAQKLLGIEFLDDISFDSFFKEIQADISMGDLLYMEPNGNTERSITIDKKRFLRLNFAAFSINNKIGGIVVVIHDITKQQKLEQSRRNFVADVSHELRTPLTTIKSYAETLSATPDAPPELSAKFLNVIGSEADRMARIISDLLTLSELDDKTSAYKLPEPIDLRSMVKLITERMQIESKKKNQTLLYNPINEVPVINGDRDGLERVVINIISNAVKYTPDGGTINVYTSCVYNDICIKVSDNGIGIPKENLPHIFDRFYRVDKARTRGTGGTGLGLAIAKQTIEGSFGGKIKITSEPDCGTEVSITIPVERT